jgi:cytochrome P450
VFLIVSRQLHVPMRILGYDLPAGTRVAPCIYLAQRREASYPDREEFSTERFLQRRPGPASWLPFGGGYSRCIGAEFSLYQMKVILSVILARTSLRPGSRTPVKAIRRFNSLIPSQGMPMVMDARRDWISWEALRRAG